jgi:hypothetical protein
MVAKEQILRKVMNDVETTGDLFWIRVQLERIYLEKLVQDNILKVINNRIYDKNVSQRES